MPSGPPAASHGGSKGAREDGVAVKVPTQAQAGPTRPVSLLWQSSKCLSQWVSTCRFFLMGKEAETANQRVR